MLNVIDEFTHKCLTAIRVSRRLKSIDVIDALWDLFILHRWVLRPVLLAFP